MWTSLGVVCCALLLERVTFLHHSCGVLPLGVDDFCVGILLVLRGLVLVVLGCGSLRLCRRCSCPVVEEKFRLVQKECQLFFQCWGRILEHKGISFALQSSAHLEVHIWIEDEF